MPQSAADIYSACTICKESAKKKLYQCTVKDCKQYLEICCVECGEFTHRNVDDHKFDINADHVIESKIQVN